MITPERLKQIEDEAKKSFDKLMEEQPEEIEKELREGNTLGFPENLIDRDDYEDERDEHEDGQ